MTLFDRFFKRQSPATPTDLLVGLVAQKIQAEALTTDQMLIRSYYDSHRWRWVDKHIYLDFDTECYAKDASCKSITQLVHFDPKTLKASIIDLTPDHKRLLIGALNQANEHAKALAANEKRMKSELAACDALAGVLGVGENAD